MKKLILSLLCFVFVSFFMYSAEQPLTEEQKEREKLKTQLNDTSLTIFLGGYLSKKNVSESNADDFRDIFSLRKKKWGVFPESLVPHEIGKVEFDSMILFINNKLNQLSPPSNTTSTTIIGIITTTTTTTISYQDPNYSEIMKLKSNKAFLESTYQYDSLQNKYISTKDNFSETDRIILFDIFNYTGFLAKHSEITSKINEKKEYEFDGRGQYYETIKSLSEEGFSSVLSFSMSNGFDKNDYTINGNKPDYMSDVIVREIGDFTFGSQVLKNENTYRSNSYNYKVYKQSFLGLAKTEWVIRTYLKNHNASDKIPNDWDENVEEIENKIKDYERMVLSIGPFVSLLSKKYLVEKLTTDTELKKLIDQTSDVEIIANELWKNAWDCPNEFNFFVHSMGGEHIMRYVNGYMEGENLYGYNTDRTTDEQSIYQYYQNYTKDKFEKELKYYNNLNDNNAYLTDRFFSNDDNFSHLGDLTTMTPTEFSSFKADLSTDSTHYSGYWLEKIRHYTGNNNIPQPSTMWITFLDGFHTAGKFNTCMNYKLNY